MIVEKLVRSPGFEPGIISLEGQKSSNCLKRFDSGLFIDWRCELGELTDYLNAQHFTAEYTKGILRQLERFVPVIREPMDIVKVCTTLTDGQKHNLNRALSAMFRFYELKGVDPLYLGALRKAIPKDNVGIDLNVPVESEIVNCIRKFPTIPPKYQVLYNLLLDSGLRVIEGVRLLREFSNGSVEEVKGNGFYRCTLGYFRGSKLAYAAYFTDYTFELIKRNKEVIDENATSHYAYQFKLLAPKYYRKFAFDTMISEGIGIPESVADFIEGRVPKKIGAKHYTSLLKQADGFYPKYSSYLCMLRDSIKPTKVKNS